MTETSVTHLENRTFDEIEPGDSVQCEKTLTERDILLFAEVSGDLNPVHLDAEYAAGTLFKQRIAHGMWSGAQISALLGVHLPGPGTIYLGQNLSFRAPVCLGDTIKFELTVSDKREDRKIVTFQCKGSNQHGKTVVTGEAQVIAPTDKVRLPRPSLPNITIG